MYRIEDYKEFDALDSGDDDPDSGSGLHLEYDWKAMSQRNSDPFGPPPPLDFICTKNRAGHNAAGHIGLAEWLDRSTARI